MSDGLFPLTIRRRDYRMRKAKGLPALRPLRFPVTFSKRLSDVGVSVNVNVNVKAVSQDPDRASSHPRLRSVTSMTEPLPLYLSHPADSSGLLFSQQLRRPNSSPTTLKEIEGSYTEDTTTERSLIKQHYSSTPIPMQTATGIAFPHALFDLGIFQPQPKSPSLPPTLPREESEAIYRCPSLASPFEDKRKLGYFGAESVKQHSDNDWKTQNEGACKTSEPKLEDSTIDPLGAKAIRECAVAVSTEAGSWSDSNASAIAGPESVSLGGSLSETSWLDDASDDEGSHCHSFASSLSEAQSPYPGIIECFSVEEEGLEGMDGSTIEYAATLSPSRAILVDVPSRRPSTSSAQEYPNSPASPVPERPRLSLKVPVTPPSSPHPRTTISNAQMRVEGLCKVRRDIATAEVPAGTVLTPPHTPEKSRLRPTSMRAGLAEVLSILEQAVAESPEPILQIDSPAISLLREHINSSRPSSTNSILLPPVRLDDNQPAAKLCYFQTIFGASVASPGVLSSRIYAHLLALDFLNDKALSLEPRCPVYSELDQQQHQQERIEILKRTLTASLARLANKAVGSDTANEILVRALSVIVGLLEARSSS